MGLNTLQSWLWRAACSIRGEVVAARYKDYILPLVFYKRLDDVYADELTKLARGLGVDDATAEAFAVTDRSLVRFYLPGDTRWRTVRSTTTNLGVRLTDNLRAIARENPDLAGVVNRRDFKSMLYQLMIGQIRLLRDDGLPVASGGINA